jgi:hypothetical protein
VEGFVVIDLGGLKPRDDLGIGRHVGVARIDAGPGGEQPAAGGASASINLAACMSCAI